MRPGASHRTATPRRLPRVVWAWWLSWALVLVACGTPSQANQAADLPEADVAALGGLLASSEQPVLINVWASWCIPCRSEAPLLAAAYRRFGGEVRFIGIDVNDRQEDARRFLAEFGLDDFEHLFDRDGAVPAHLGGRGVPLTYFFRPGGQLSYLHHGVIDERTLALHLDDLVRG